MKNEKVAKLHFTIVVVSEETQIARTFQVTTSRVKAESSLVGAFMSVVHEFIPTIAAPFAAELAQQTAQKAGA